MNRSSLRIVQAVTLILTFCLRPASADILGTPSTNVASRGGVAVTLEDVDAFAEKIPPEKRAGFFASPTRIEKAIDNLLMTKQLAAEARAAKLDKDPVIARQMELAADEALALARRQQFDREIKVPDMSQLAREEFLAHKDKYVKHGESVVEHILIDTKTRSDADAQTLAQDIRQRAQAAPDTFEALVQQYSDDPSKVENHGKLPDAANPKIYDGDFVAAVVKLHQPGEISPVVKTSYGYHIIKLLTRTSDMVPSFDQAKEQIVKELSTAYIEKASRAHSSALAEQPLELNGELVRSLQTRYTPGGAGVPAN